MTNKWQAVNVAFPIRLIPSCISLAVCSPPQDCCSVYLPWCPAPPTRPSPPLFERGPVCIAPLLSIVILLPLLWTHVMFASICLGISFIQLILSTLQYLNPSSDEKWSSDESRNDHWSFPLTRPWAPDSVCDCIKHSLSWTWTPHRQQNCWVPECTLESTHLFLLLAAGHHVLKSDFPPICSFTSSLICLASLQSTAPLSASPLLLLCPFSPHFPVSLPDSWRRPCCISHTESNAITVSARGATFPHPGWGSGT